MALLVSSNGVMEGRTPHLREGISPHVATPFLIESLQSGSRMQLRSSVLFFVSASALRHGSINRPLPCRHCPRMAIELPQYAPTIEGEICGDRTVGGQTYHEQFTEIFAHELTTTSQAAAASKHTIQYGTRRWQCMG